ncbi:MAG: hypothetical protein E2O79_07815 [Caldithrix sp.]|nr:MAG: hypothetical protein E2O79_07815 [Caldithrix sp.]
MKGLSEAVSFTISFEIWITHKILKRNVTSKSLRVVTVPNDDVGTTSRSFLVTSLHNNLFPYLKKPDIKKGK